jgi:hypothetical protein
VTEALLAVLRPQLERLGYTEKGSGTEMQIFAPDGREVFRLALDARDAELLRVLDGLGTLAGIPLG